MTAFCAKTEGRGGGGGKGGRNPVSATHVSLPLSSATSLLSLAVSGRERILPEECRLWPSPGARCIWGGLIPAHSNVCELGKWLKTSHRISVCKEAEQGTTGAGGRRCWLACVPAAGSVASSTYRPVSIMPSSGR